MKVEIVNPSNVDSVWPLISDRVVACLQKTPTDIGAGEFWQMCRSGSAFLIVCHDGEKIVSASIWQFRDEYFTALLLVGENSKQWFKDLIEFASVMARHNGCKGIIAGGRKGLAHLFKRDLGKVNVIRQTYFVEI